MLICPLNVLGITQKNWMGCIRGAIAKMVHGFKISNKGVHKGSTMRIERHYLKPNL